MFFKFLFNMSLGVAVLYSVMIIHHLATTSYSYSALCPGMFSMPCLLYYSRFDRLSDNYYSITLILFAVLSLMVSVSEWVSFDLIRKKRDLYEDKKKKYSRMFLNMWDWRQATANFEGKQ